VEANPPGYLVVPAPAGTVEGQTYSSGTFGPAPAPTPPPQAQLAANLISAASRACSTIVGQIFPDAAHQSAFQNSAAIVNGSGGSAPASGVLATKFAALASVYGLSASAFAALIVVMQGASLDLSAALGTLTAAAETATTSGQLATALAVFETAIGAVVAEINAGSPPTQIVAPAAITIAGINA
jgi:hypothetical protein